MRKRLIGVALLALASVSQGAEAPNPGTVFSEREGVTHVTIAGRPVLNYNGPKTPLPAGFEPAFQRGGYIHPVYTPSGKIVSDDYPPAHKHHHGIWSPWTKTSFEGREPDFWNMGKKTGTVEFAKREPTVKASRGAMTFGSHHRFVDLTAKPDPKPVLDERWDVTVYDAKTGPDKPAHVFDLTITQTCATDSPLILPKYHYGGLGFRGRRDWDGAGNCEFLSSEGKTRTDGNETTARWCWVGGKADGDVAGIAVLCHPDNFRAPQPIRIHPTEPFLCFAPQQAGEFRIEPGTPYVARYRFVVTDGPADKELIERLYEDFGKTPPPSAAK